MKYVMIVPISKGDLVRYAYHGDLCIYIERDLDLRRNLFYHKLYNINKEKIELYGPIVPGEAYNNGMGSLKLVSSISDACE